jgi:hypothetical protein
MWDSASRLSVQVSICVPSAATEEPSPHAEATGNCAYGLITSVSAAFSLFTVTCRRATIASSCADTPRMCRAAWYGPRLQP